MNCNVRILGVSLVLAAAYASLSGVVCYVANGSVKACSEVSPPPSPTLPDCIVQTFNEDVPKILATTLGSYYANPGQYRCGYSKGRAIDGGGCSDEGVYVFVGNYAVGYTPAGPGCSNPD